MNKGFIKIENSSAIEAIGFSSDKIFVEYLKGKGKVYSYSFTGSPDRFLNAVSIGKAISSFVAGSTKAGVRITKDDALLEMGISPREPRKTIDLTLASNQKGEWI